MTTACRCEPLRLALTVEGMRGPAFLRARSLISRPFAGCSRILDIIKQIKKQKAEIGRVVADVREVQLDINAAAERLRRAEAVADESIYKVLLPTLRSSQRLVPCLRRALTR